MKKFNLLILFAVSFCVANAQSDSSLKAYTGVYKFPAGSVVSSVEVGLDDKGLSMTSAAGTSELKRMAADTFSIVSFDGIAVFKRNEQKKVIGVSIDARGYQMDGTKENPVSVIYSTNRRYLLVVRFVDMK